MRRSDSTWQWSAWYPLDILRSSSTLSMILPSPHGKSTQHFHYFVVKMPYICWCFKLMELTTIQRSFQFGYRHNAKYCKESPPPLLFSEALCLTRCTATCSKWTLMGTSLFVCTVSTSLEGENSISCTCCRYVSRTCWKVLILHTPYETVECIHTKGKEENTCFNFQKSNDPYANRRPINLKRSH